MHNIKSFYLVLLFFLFASVGISQNKKDSLLALLKNPVHDTEEVKTLAILADAYQVSGEIEHALKTANQSVELALKLNLPKFIIIAKKKLAFVLYKSDLSSNISEAENLSKEVVELSVKTSNNAGIAGGKRILALLAMRSGDYNKAILKQLDVMKICEEMNNKDDLAVCFGDLGAVYYYSGNSVKAKEYWEKSLKINIELNKTQNQVINYGNLSTVCLKMGDLDLAEQYVLKAMEINKKNNNQLLYASSILNLANVKFSKKQYTEAIDLTKQAIEIFHKSQQITSECRSYINMLEMYRRMGERGKGLEIAKKIMSFEKELEEPAEKIHLYENLSVFFEETKDFERAYLYKDLQMELNDSLFSLDLTKQATELETKYAAEKKEKENELLNQKFELEHQKVEVEHAQSMQHKIMLYFSIPLVLFFILMAVILFRQNKVKQKANGLLNQKNLIIEEKSKIVEEQNKDITDSIRYAQRIQAAILPPDKLWYSILPDSFVLYRPKDILSGDFYWVEETENHIFFAAADCTGHGVPGALMSVVNFNLLNKAALEKNIVKPNEILNAVNEWLTGSLHQTFQESTVKDGMDISVCVIDKKTKEFHFAGANNPVYIIANGTTKIIAGDKFPVGAFIEEQRRSFTNHVFPIVGNETVYIFSDGYADQFGGPKGKKFKYKPFQEKILAIQDLTLQKQKHELLKTFEDWKGDLEQIDDVLVVGVKLYTV